MPKSNKRPVRVVAAMVVLQVCEQGQSLTRALANGQQQLNSPNENALLQEMCYGSLRWFYRLDALLSGLLKKPMKERDQDVFCLLIVGLYQLDFMHIPDHAVIKETVNAVIAMRKTWAKGLVNALLREHQRQSAKQPSDWVDDEEARFAHPEWMIELMKQDWPDQYERVLDANNERPPMVLRANQLQVSRDAYVQELQVSGIAAKASAIVDTALILEQAVDVFALPGFSQGRVSVQDSAAQLAACLLDLQPGMRVLDACCAPGGKTMHILEQCPGLKQVVGLDIDEQRLQQVRENLERASMSADLLVGDAAITSSWWDGVPFDRILLDAPCSGSGVIRRHPDIKLLRTEQDIESLVERQAQILAAVWPLLAPGGMLVYATCSVFKQENTMQLESFLGHCEDAREVTIDAKWGVQCEHGIQVLPGQQGMDGFFYARLEKLK